MTLLIYHKSGFLIVHVLLYHSDSDKRDTSAWLATVFDDDDVDVYNKRLAIGALIAEEMRAAVYSETGFRCSAGIAHNKVG